MTSQNVWTPPESTPLDEARWQAWVAKGRTADERAKDSRLRALKWIATVGLLATAVLWSRAEPYEVVVRFIVAAGAIAVMLQTLRSGRYAFAAVFAAVAVLFNPIAPIFGFSGDWQRMLLVASAAPFVASLTWRNPKAVA